MISESFWQDLRRETRGAVKTDKYSRILYSTDASIYKVEPLGVFFPQHRDEIQAAVEIAARHSVPVLMRGGGTSLAGQTVNKALIIDASRHLNHVLEINAAEKWARVEPGVVMDTMNAALRPYGLQFGPDPASGNRATMGGIVSNNSTGSHSIVYGMTADHVLRLSAVLSDGSTARFGPVSAAELPALQRQSGLSAQIYRRLPQILRDKESAIRQGTPRHWRRCGGYNLDRLLDPDALNLAKLLCGAEGTLGAIQDITLNLVERPKFTGLAVVHFKEMRRAMESVPLILENNPSAVELMDNLGLTMCRDAPEYARLLATFIEGQPDTILITEFTGDTKAEVDDKLDKYAALLQKQRIGYTVTRPPTPEIQANVWEVRKAGLGLLMSVKGDHKPIPFIEDSAVPVEHLAEYITRLEDFCHTLDVNVAYYAHASAGCLHVRPLINLKEAAEAGKMEAISNAVVDLVARYGGAFSSEHGDGRARSWQAEHFYGPDLYDAFKQVKTLFDPRNLLNPGNIVNAGPMTENLRFGADYKVISLREELDFSEDGGFHRAVEMCNGAAVCRKDTGNMCPSFQATRDEEHSTRGRANLLRAALSGDLSAEELTSPRMFEAMDLCVECKSCKSECPSSVDMAKIKTEFLAHYYRANPVPLRSRLFAAIGALSEIGSGALAPLVNGIIRNPLTRWGMDKFLGIERRRQMPAFARTPFTAWFKKRASNPSADLRRKPVVLFSDTFNTYNYPQVAIAATEVLEAAGFRVILPGAHNCGRPMISKGLVKQAKKTAARTVAALIPYAKENIPIVGLEPSSVSAITDDYLFLLPGNKDARRVAQMTLTFEEFIAQQSEDPDFHLPLDPAASRKFLLHGHCHQKALIGTDPALKLLRLLSPDVDEIEDAGCCGMAGSFGYEKEHYELSLKMAERKLAPAVRAVADDVTLVAAGVSCRQQITHTTGRVALHPAQVLRQALSKG